MNRDFIQAVGGFIRKEFAQTLRDPRMRILLFVAPMIQLTLFGVAISTEVKNVRLAAHFPASDDLTPILVRDSLTRNWFIPARLPPELRASGDPFRWIQSDEADAVIVAPPEGLRAAIERGQGRIQLLVNATNVIRAQSVESYLNQILARTLRRELKLNAPTSPLNLDVRVLFNPALETAWFMVPGVMSLILCLVTTLVTSMALAREKEVGTFETLIAAPLKTHEILLGKTIPYVIMGLVEVPLVLAVATLGFGVPIRGPILVLMAVTVLFVCATVAAGTLISTLAKNQQQAMLGSFLFLFPAILFSGVMFPIENMPGYMRWISYLDPITYFVILLRNILLKGGDLEIVLWNGSALALIAVVLIGLSFKRFKHSLG